MLSLMASLTLRLADGTPAEAYERLARALDAGEVSPHAFDLLTRALERRLHILDAERFRQRLEAAEARASEAARLARPALASQSTVEVGRRP